jgi:hypothetical protein
MVCVFWFLRLHFNLQLHVSHKWGRLFFLSVKECAVCMNREKGRLVPVLSCTRCVGLVLCIVRIGNIVYFDKKVHLFPDKHLAFLTFLHFSCDGRMSGKDWQVMANCEDGENRKMGKITSTLQTSNLNFLVISNCMFFKFYLFCTLHIFSKKT